MIKRMRQVVNGLFHRRWAEGKTLVGEAKSCKIMTCATAGLAVDRTNKGQTRETLRSPTSVQLMKRCRVVSADPAGSGLGRRRHLSRGQQELSTKSSEESRRDRRRMSQPLFINSDWSCRSVFLTATSLDARGGSPLTWSHAVEALPNDQ